MSEARNMVTQRQQTSSRVRSRASAREAGARFERQVADWLKLHVSEWVDRRVKTGAKDRGDIANLRAHGKPVVAELKDCARLDLAGWLAEAEQERVNDGALAGVVIHKRRGVADPGRQYVTMSLADLAAILTGARVLSTSLADSRIYATDTGEAGNDDH